MDNEENERSSYVYIWLKVFTCYPYRCALRTKASMEKNNIGEFKKSSQDSEMSNGQMPHGNECGCTLLLTNHLTGCQCSIFNGVICSLHHTFFMEEGGLCAINCGAIKKSCQEYWLTQASLEMGVPVEEMRRRNSPQHSLWEICDIGMEISRANQHKFLREHPGWQGFDSPANTMMPIAG